MSCLIGNRDWELLWNVFYYLLVVVTTTISSCKSCDFLVHKSTWLVIWQENALKGASIHHKIAECSIFLPELCRCPPSGLLAAALPWWMNNIIANVFSYQMEMSLCLCFWYINLIIGRHCPTNGKDGILYGPFLLTMRIMGMGRVGGTIHQRWWRRWKKAW